MSRSETFIVETPDMFWTRFLAAYACAVTAIYAA